jgi:2-methylcitrate dehydratase PrpD
LHQLETPEKIEMEASFSMRSRNSNIPLAMRIAEQTASMKLAASDDALHAKVKTCLYDLIGCAYEAVDKPWSNQAMQMAAACDAGAAGAKKTASIAGVSFQSSLADAAFVNAVMGHGLVREDMHSASISHLGVVVLPTLLALSQHKRVSGREFMTAVVIGYEVGAQIGRALMDAKIARIYRPTGITGPIGAAAAGARLLGLGVDQTTHAIALAANTVAGFNQWGHTGGSEMYFHVGVAARNAVSSVLLAQAGAFASPSVLDGEAGLFASHGKQEQASHVKMFGGSPEILAVYHKPVPACNFAQTASQAAIEIARTAGFISENIAAIRISVPSAGANYPGCNFLGPFDHVLQAKMSIQFNVAAALLLGNVTEDNFERLQDPRLHRLLEITSLEIDPLMTKAYPARQGGGVQVVLADGTEFQQRLDNVVNASDEDVLTRFRLAGNACVGSARTDVVESLIENLLFLEDAGQLAASLSK